MLALRDRQTHAPPMKTQSLACILGLILLPFELVQAEESVVATPSKGEKATAATAPVQKRAEFPPISDAMRLELLQIDVRDVVSFYSQLTGKLLVSDSTIQGQLSITAARPVTRAQAIKIIESSLLLNGFTLVDRGDDMVVVLGLSKNARGAGVPIVTRLEDLPATDRVVSFLFKVKHHDPVFLQQLLQQYITVNLYTSFVADQASRTLMVTESAPVLRKIALYLAEIDTEETGRNLRKLPTEAPTVLKAKPSTR